MSAHRTRRSTGLYTLHDPGPGAEPVDLPPASARVVEAIRDGSAAGMLPPVVVPGPEQTVMWDSELNGARDARLIARALADPRFAPLNELLTRLDRWCEANRDHPGLASGVLRITNPGVFDPLVSECFVACATLPTDRARATAAERAAQYEAFLELFLHRLARDLGGDTWPADPALSGPVTAIRANAEETHNGGQRVLRLDLAGGASVAYKPRPASGETFFLGTEDSLFALLNGLPPAAGRFRLPVLPTWTGQTGQHTDPGGFAGYSWQEWVEPPKQQGVLRTEERSPSGKWRLTGTVLEPEQAERFWRDTGALTAVCYAFGVVDLHGGNILSGIRRGDETPLMYPVDLEAYFAGASRLAGTSLVHAPAGEGAAGDHVGLENEVRWCGLEGPLTMWRRNGDGGLTLHRRKVGFGRTETRSVVADDQGNAGYGAYLGAMLRGMFDAWMLLGRNRSAVAAFLAAHRSSHAVRVIPRQTAEYAEALDRGAGFTDEFDPDEVAQLVRGDVPYFFRAADGGPLLAMARDGAAMASFTATHAEVHSDTEPDWPPLPGVAAGERVTMTGLGIALRDAVEHVFDQVDELDRLEAIDETNGVRLRLQSPRTGQVAFDWPEQHRRITYRWFEGKVRVTIDNTDELSAPVRAPEERCPGGEVRRRLLRLDRLDGALRAPWVASAFTDTALEERLRRLTDAGLTWLRSVVDEHGWPGRSLVGARAAGVASRLVQHGPGHLEFRSRCLELVTEAAERRDMPHRDVAYVTDALRIEAGRPQLYGTKFDRVGDGLVPCPIEEPGAVDERRAERGLEPLADYARRVRTTFPLNANDPGHEIEHEIEEAMGRQVCT